MKILKKKKAGHQPQDKIRQRITNISTGELIGWVENSLYVIGKEITNHQKTRNIDALHEVRQAAHALGMIADELIERAKNEF